MEKTLVSIIIPVKNSSTYLADCLSSIKAQSYKDIEVLVVDSHSADATLNIAKQFGVKILQFEKKQKMGIFDAPFKRNYGVEHSKGSYVYYVDADMQLPQKLVEEIITLFGTGQFGALVVAEDSVGSGIWAKAKQLERRCYWGDDTIEAARVFTRKTWNAMGGLDTSLGGGGDDWDLHQRILSSGLKIGRTKNYVLHNEGNLKLSSLMKKRFMYGRDSIKYLVKKPKASFVSYFPIRLAFIRNWRLFAKSPIVSATFIIMRFCEYAAGFAGIIYSRFDYD